MKHLKILLVIGVLLSSFVISCTKDAITETDLDGSKKCASVTVIGEFPEFPCYGEELCLIAGQHTNAGTVSIANTEEALFIRFVVDDPLLINEVHVWIGEDLEDAPLNNKNTPVPGQFPYKAGKVRNDTITIVIPISSVPDGCFYVLAHAALSNGETAWGGACDANASTTFKEAFGTTRWGFIAKYCPETCTNFVALKVQYLLGGVTRSGIMTGTRYFNSNDWCSLMGVNEVATHTYDLVSSYNVKVGSVSIVKKRDYFTVNVTLSEAGATLVKTYLFYGLKEELNDIAKFGDCPEFTQFPIIVSKPFVKVRL